MNLTTSKQYAESRGVAVPTVTLHARKLGIEKIADRYLFTPEQCRALDASIVGKVGRPAHSWGVFALYPGDEQETLLESGLSANDAMARVAERSREPVSIDSPIYSAREISDAETALFHKDGSQ